MKLPKALNEATAGAALKYHIKRALERSHSISEFSKNLELSAQKSHFSNNTLKIIEELNNGVKQASEEIKEKATKYEKALQELQKIDESKLTKEQKQVLKVFKGELDKGEIKKIDLNDLYILEQGTRHAGARKILRKHYGEESTGGVTNDELLNISEVIKNGSVLLESFERLKNGFRYGYEWDNNGVKLRLVVDDLNDGNKIFDFYSDRNFKDFRDARPQPSTSKDNGTQPITLDGPNPTTKPLTDQEDLLKTSENLNEATQEAKNLSPLEQANAEKLVKLEHAITPLKEFGKNYPEFALKPKEALEKLLQEKNGQVAGAAFREDLGGIDFVWGTPKTKESNGYGLAHILEKREKQYKRLGLTNKQAKERTKELLKQIPEVIEKGIKDNDYIGHATIRHNGIEVGLSSQKGNTPLKNHYMITSFEIDEKVLRELKTIGTLSNNYRDGINYSTSNLNNPNPTTNALKTQEPLSEQANAKKLIKLESEKGIKAEALKKLNFDEIKKLIDESPNNGKDIIVIGDNNLTPEIVEYIHKKHAKVGIERLDEDEITAFNFTYPKNAKAIIDYQGIQHALNKHGINSPSVKFSKQPPITYKDIANYRDIVKNADETIKRDNRIISYKQVNGHFVVVEQINRNKSEFIFKTMFKEKGEYKNAPDYKKNIKENN
ncbi:DUF3519 domain-containing protein [Helicobacter pylori]